MRSYLALTALLLPVMLIAQDIEKLQRKTVLDDGTEVTTDVTVATQIKTPEKDATPEKIKTMILVDNRAGAQYHKQVVRFESQVASSLDDSVLSIISRDETIRAQKIYDGEQPTDSTAEANAKLGTQKEALTALRKIVFNAMNPVSGTATTTEDWKTLRNSTALNMARNIGADLILAVSIDSISSETRSYSGSGVKKIGRAHV